MPIFRLRRALHFSKTSPAMAMRSLVLGSLAALLVALGGGCGKSTPDAGAAGRQPLPLKSQPAAEIIARVHWIGMKQLAAETNAASFLRMWNLPETAKLERQTLDKLALALVGATVLESNYEAIASGRLASTAANQVPGRTNQPPFSNTPSPSSALQSAISHQLSTNSFRPLLDDLVNEESYLEVRQATNQPGTLALAIRLDAQRAALWRTNLATALESRTGIRPAPTTNGWIAQVQSPESRVQSPKSAGQSPDPVVGRQASVVSKQWAIALVCSGEWTILALGPSAASNQLSTHLPQLSTFLRLDPVTRRLQSAQGSPATDYWLEANADLRRVASALSLGTELPEDVLALALAVTGDGKNVLTSGRLNFSKPLPLELEPWNIPTNLVHDPLDSFTAIRGIRPWLSSVKAWNDLQVGTPPNQLFFWAQPATLPFMTYCAAPLPDASNRVASVTERLLREYNPWITNNTLGRLEWSANFNGLGWLGVPFIVPFLRSVADGGGGFAYGGLFAYPFTNRPPPGLLFQQVTTQTNLVYYDWEVTGQRVDEWLHIGQLLRLLFGKANLPPNSASMAWLNAAKTNLANSITGAAQTGPEQLAFTRISTAGLTALEMHLLTDWFESPQFPRGLNTFVGPQRTPPRPGGTPPVLKNQPKPASATASKR